LQEQSSRRKAAPDRQGAEIDHNVRVGAEVKTADGADYMPANTDRVIFLEHGNVDDPGGWDEGLELGELLLSAAEESGVRIWQPFTEEEPIHSADGYTRNEPGDCESTRIESGTADQENPPMRLTEMKGGELGDGSAVVINAPIPSPGLACLTHSRPYPFRTPRRSFP
jgi:hypothetical protein